MKASYLETYNSGKLKNISDKLNEALESCAICPRDCKVNRLKGKMGFCKTAILSRVYSYLAHHGEEPPISGSKGSGAIFFSGCNMACVYCQNFEFSQKIIGQEVDAAKLSEIMLKLQEEGCYNINFVTPSHVLPQILKALEVAIPQGLKIPLVYNTSSYDLPETIKFIDGIFDIYLADMRYGDNKEALIYSQAPNYWDISRQAIKEMYSQVGVAKFDSQGIIERGLIIRHLVLPNNLAATENVMKFIRDELSDETYISLMSQYTPFHKALEFKELNRRIGQDEYNEAAKILEKYTLHNGWIQESGGLESFAGPNIKPKI